jgi:uncharacterized protein (DUF169 family)
MLNLSTHPVAVKYFKSFDKEREWELIELGFYRPGNPINICQCVGLARHHSRSVFVTGQDMACKIEALAMGMHPFDDEMRKGEIAIRDGVRSNPVLRRELFEKMPRIEHGKIKAVACAPLHKMGLNVDQIIIYGNPLQILKVIQAHLWSTGARLDFSTCGKYGVCVEAMANSFVTKGPSVGFPCRGERTSSIVQDDEMFVALPAELIDGVVEGLDKTRHLLPTPMPFAGVDQPPYYLPDYYLTEQAKSKRDGG